MSITSIITQITDNTTSFKSVSHAYSMTPVEKLKDSTPCVYVYPGDEIAGPNASDNKVNQQVRIEVKCFIVCEFASENLATLRAELRAALLDFQVVSTGDSIEFSKGSAEDIKGEFIWWLDTYFYTDRYRS